MKKLITSKTAFCCLIALAMAGVALFDTPTDAEMIAGDYVWITRPQSDPAQAQCAQNAGTECVELCQTFGNTVIPTSQKCCLEKSKVGGWDHPSECNNWIYD